VIEQYEPYLKNLPVFPDVAARVLAMAEDRQEVSFKQLEGTISLDPGLTAKVLKVANSALYARQREIKSLQTAITLLGLKNIRSLVLLVAASSAFAQFTQTRFYQFFWRHSILSAFFARHIALRAARKEAAEECFVGAVLHDIGQVAFFNAGAERYGPVADLLEQGRETVEELETRLYGLNHRELGSSILKKWNFPDLYADMALEHQSLNITSTHKALIILVSIADILAEAGRVGLLGEEKERLLAALLPHTPLSAGDVDYYRSRFLADLGQDLLFHECQSLFRIPD
jgi:HD-like signal output (HDOD) protein